jgi:hypothetical protein
VSFRLLARIPALHKRAATGDAAAVEAVANLERLAGALRLAIPT